MKKTIAITLIVLVCVTALFASGAKEAQGLTTLKVGATPEPHAAFLNLVKEELKAEGVNLEVIEFTDYVTPNKALEEGQIDANYFQHIPYLESFNTEQGYHLVNAGGIHIEPIALYSNNYKTVDSLPVGGSIAIPNDPTNGGRALLLLQSVGLITLKADAGISATPLDIESNPHNIKFKEIEAASLPRVLADVDAAVINGNYAIPAGLKANVDGLAVEGSDSPYVNVVAVKEGNENNAAVKALVKALQSDTIKDYVAATYPNGEVVVVF